MNRKSLPTLALLLLCACDSGLELELDGKQCDGNGSCVSGYVCDVGRNLCVRPDQLLRTDLDAAVLEQGGAAGELGWGGAAGSTGDASTLQAGAGGAGSVPGNGGSAALQDAGEDSDSGTGSPDDAGDAGCTPVLLYPDQDGDGVGLTAGGTLRCPAPGWVSLSGDCRDDLPNAFPGQTAYFDEGYEELSQPAGVSFDFDCDGSETPDPNNTFPDPAPECTVLACSGSGYLPALPARSGGGSEPRCGSNQLGRCAGGLAPVAFCGPDPVTVADRFRCK